MAIAKNGDKVSVHYAGRLADGTVFDSSEGRAPLEFVVGRHQVITGFEQAVEGLGEGESISTTITAAQAYGERREDLVMRVPRSRMPEGLDVREGQQLHLRQPNGRAVTARVVALDTDVVTLDTNHHLAGKALTFDIRLVKIG